MPVDATAAFAWERTGAPQVRHSHAFLARLRNLLRDRAPDVLEALLVAGAFEIPFIENLPQTLRIVTASGRRRAGRARRAGARPSNGCCGGSCSPSPASSCGTVSRPATLDRTRAACRTGSTASRPISSSMLGVHARPRTSGSQSIGAPPVAEELHESGIVYFSRFYRVAPGVEAPGYAGPTAADLGYLKFAIFLGDNRTFSITYAVESHDDELRKLLLQPDAFETVAQRSLRPRRGAPRASPIRSPTCT